MPTIAKSVEMSKIVMNSEIHLHHCLCEFSGFKTGKSNHRRCSVKNVFLKILQNWQKRTCVWVRHGFSTVTFTKLSKKLFLQNPSGRLLLMKKLHGQKFYVSVANFLNSQLYHSPPEWWLLFWRNEGHFLIQGTWRNFK